jgi:hypothetical protein
MSPEIEISILKKKYESIQKKIPFFSMNVVIFLSDECEPYKRINKETDVGINFTVRTFIKRTATTNNNISLFVARNTEMCMSLCTD